MLKLNVTIFWPQHLVAVSVVSEVETNSFLFGFFNVEMAVSMRQLIVV